MKKIKILFIGTSDIRGGAARIGWDVGNWMKSQGHDVKYLVGRKSSDKNYVYETKKIKFFSALKRLTRIDLNLYYSHLISFLFANDLNHGSEEEVINHPWFKNADIVHCHNLHGNFFKLSTLNNISKEKPIVWTLHDMWSFTGRCAYANDCNNWKKECGNCPHLNDYQPMLWDNTRNLLEFKKNIYQMAKLNLVVPSGWLKKEVAKSILSDKKIKLIYNGIDTKIFCPKEKISLRNKYNIPLDKKIICFVAQGGKNDPRKGGAYINRLVKEDIGNNILYLAIGGSKHSTEKGNVINIPFISDKHILSDYFALSDIFLFTSLAENCPLVILEAMSCGLPVVSFDVGGVPELIKNNLNGLVVKTGSFSALKLALKKMVHFNNQKISAISIKNRKDALGKFGLSIMSKKYLQLYETLLSAPRSR